MLDRNLLLQGIIRWTARITSVISTLILSLFVFGEPFPVRKITGVEWLGLMLFPVGVVIGFAVAWWREGLGSTISIGSLVAFYIVFVFVMNEPLTDGGWFLVFAFPGFLFLISSLMTGSKKSVVA
ncbi:MAG TPA: hypothetical protein VLA93_22035 [Pyrinomonadaceae bacterium]|nr:hypothetical protein [Pyrinomonadaceae bacterium]